MPKETRKALDKATGEMPPDRVHFLAYYLGGPQPFNASRAAMAAFNYTLEEAYRRSYEILKEPEVQKAINAWRRERIRTADASLEKYTQELLSIAYAQVRDVVSWDADTVRAIPSELADDRAHAAIAEVRQTGQGVAIKMHSKTDALKLLGTLLGFLTPDENKKTDEQAEKIARILHSLGSGKSDMQGAE